MKLALRASVAIVAALAIGGVASAQNMQEDTAWQFKSPSERAVQQNSVVLMQQKQNDYYKMYKNGAAGVFGTGGSGLFGSASQATNNFTQIINQTSNNCTSSGSTGAVSCGGGSVNGNSVDQTTTGSTNSSSTTNTGNTVVNKPTTNTNSGNTGSQLNLNSGN